MNSGFYVFLTLLTHGDISAKPTVDSVSCEIYNCVHTLWLKHAAVS